MALTEKVLRMLNTQIGMEFQASINYDSISAHFQAEDLPQLAGFFWKQASEERTHAHKIMKHVLDCGGRVQIPALSAPPHTFSSSLEAAEYALASEEKVTASIHTIYETALAEKDYATSTMLHWFITEQIEEIATMKQMVANVKRVKDAGVLTLEDLIADTKESNGG